MGELSTSANFDDGDRAYTAIIDAHRDLSDAESQDLNARLVLILANHIGDRRVLDEALALARRSMGKAV
jgi:hypothetical protein